MADNPILFSAPMVRSLIVGRKTQTRRLLRIRGHRSFSEFGRSDTMGYDWNFRDAEKRWHDLRHAEMVERLPHVVGDRLWVRETITRFDKGTCDQWVWYRAGKNSIGVHAAWVPAWGMDEDGPWLDGDGPAGGAPYNVVSIHMPRWASRITLVVTDVRVHRLQDISEADAIAEGVYPAAVYGGKVESWLPAENMRDRFYSTARDAYAALWDGINGAGSWAANPWVVAYTFTVHKMNIDDMRKDEANG